MSYIYERDSEKRKETYRRLKSAVFQLLGRKCVRCNFEDMRALQIDHIHGKGYLHRKRIQGKAFYRHILENSIRSLSDYQILCANCNWIKRDEQNENRGRIKK